MGEHTVDRDHLCAGSGQLRRTGEGKWHRSAAVRPGGPGQWFRCGRTNNRLPSRHRDRLCARALCRVGSSRRARTGTGLRPFIWLALMRAMRDRLCVDNHPRRSSPVPVGTAYAWTTPQVTACLGITGMSLPNPI